MNIYCTRAGSYADKPGYLQNEERNNFSIVRYEQFTVYLACATTWFRVNKGQQEATDLHNL